MKKRLTLQPLQIIGDNTNKNTYRLILKHKCFLQTNLLSLSWSWEIQVTKKYTEMHSNCITSSQQHNSRDEKVNFLSKCISPADAHDLVVKKNRGCWGATRRWGSRGNTRPQVMATGQWAVRACNRWDKWIRHKMKSMCFK